MKTIYIIMNLEGEPVLALDNKDKAEAVAKTSYGLSGVISIVILIEDRNHE